MKPTITSDPMKNNIENYWTIPKLDKPNLTQVRNT